MGDLYKQDKDFLWHSMKPYNPNETVIVKEADGVTITDKDGKQYLDAMSGLWCVNVGYGRKELAEVAAEQMKQLAYYPLTQSHQPAIELAAQINELLGGGYVIYFSNSGSEANETAFKIARQYHHQKGESSRHKIISRYRSYHGNTMTTLAATGQAERKYKYEPLSSGFIHVRPPDLYRNPLKREESARERSETKAIEEAIVWEMKETVAACIMEPIITGGGILIPPDDYMGAVADICAENGVLLIVDEVICGFGRTGEPFGFMNYEVKPDIITMAKGITSGYLPLAATAVKKEIYEAFQGSEKYDYLRHVNTFGGHPASCAVASRNIQIMEEERLFERSKIQGEKLKKKLVEQLEDHANIGDIRGKGLLIGLELVKNKVSKQPLDVSFLNKIIASCKEAGVIIGKNGATVANYNNVLSLAPPLIITDEQCDTLVSTVVQAIRTVLPMEE
ncbi:aminotransferase [Alkalihalobacillus alcalophilus ATCC 27647 = CGMCC 1.3604]|uniref:Aminotransferase n=2 Tax=Alkalihalobacillus alcalophilus TaxID=1445 RepID=A0A094WI67_ALKAL|nr:aspartate aminotransferase family protein [Alkalihalobacillus alcalophilus]KGA97484.1 aminotransferase [Alkalihalobacillus alcalophilus ATCC 27647 = CGMCC 1.3604]MED1563273.1 aspartate aminotransferase family protein [Alkalihalobacillus alcalophilus]THG91743.1 aminotransferase [Alkalihalobacillus alcalophilus ATCC 27647 = CGMCC 1.3604]